MDLQIYIKEQRKLLDKFESYWEKRALRDPSLFPTNMAPGDWDTMFESWAIENHPKESDK